jgi:HPt (histidine-containing phosphotransfer) domain-containing protein
MNQTTRPYVFFPPYTQEVTSQTPVSGGNVLSRWNDSISKESNLTFQMYYDRTNRDDIIIKEQRDTVDFDFQHQVALGRRHDFIWGGGYRLDNYIAKPIQSNELFAALYGSPAGLRISATQKTPKVVFDSGVALIRTGHDSELLAELIEIFLADCPWRMAELQEAITLSDAQGLERAAHKLKGAAAVFDAKSVVEAAEQLEILGRQNNVSGAREILSHLDRQIATLTRALQESLAIER